MSRDLDNLKRVLQKLQVRYGEDDALVLQVKQEIEAREVIEDKYAHWLTTYRQHLSERRGWRPFAVGTVARVAGPAMSQA